MKIPLIGKIIEVIDSSNPALKGMKGEIVDETQHQLIIKTDNHLKKIDKKAVTMKIMTHQQEIIIEGKQIAKSPEERIKTKGASR
ncbi:ribonuclease P protein subunit [Candidatus Woesearchaeota archaeon]|nr:ribonuclease P protein subunit [Candidatus Woesearchaeota archaeon]